jgi:hypothetical protein
LLTTHKVGQQLATPVYRGESQVREQDDSKLPLVIVGENISF